MDALLLLLLDSRAPSGGHAHSGGMEPAVTAGLVRDLADVELFCTARLRTSGRVAASFAAAAARVPLDDLAAWDELDAELDARLPSDALRMASRSLGSGLRRMVRSMFQSVALPWPASLTPHHPLVLGCAVALAGGDASLAARAAALHSITAPASAAVRLLGLDPLAVQGMLARLASDPGVFADPGADSTPGFGELPSYSAPFLDLLAEVHRTSEVRLFAS